MVSLLDLKSRLRKICGEAAGSGGSGDVEELKEIIQQYPQLINEVRFHNFSLACYFYISHFSFLFVSFRFFSLLFCVFLNL
jgi:hypothetical protein